MNQELSSIKEIEELAALTQEAADDRHGDKDKRLRNRRSRRLARKALAYAVGGAVTVFGGGALINGGLDQGDKQQRSYKPAIDAKSSEIPFHNSYMEADGKVHFYPATDKSDH